MGGRCGEVERARERVDVSVVPGSVRHCRMKECASTSEKVRK